MIEAGGGAIVGERAATDVRGRENGLYYLVSRW